MGIAVAATAASDGDTCRKSSVVSLHDDRRLRFGCLSGGCTSKQFSCASA